MIRRLGVAGLGAALLLGLAAASPTSTLEARVAALEAKVADLQTRVAALEGAPASTSSPSPTPAATPPTPSPTSTPTISPTPTPTPTPAAGLYGMGIGTDTLANTQVVASQLSAYAFIAGQSSALVSVRFYIVDGSGYSGGTGGVLRISVQADSGGPPSGTDLASTSITPGNPVSIGYLPLATFSSPASLVAGRTYHIVFRNVDANPSANYISIDSLFTYGAAVSQPRFEGTVWAQRVNTGSGWTVRQNFDPILALNYANGVTEGQGYMEVWINLPKSVSGAAQVRELITPTISRNVSSVGVRIRRVSGASPLTINLETGSGALIATTSVPASAIPVGAADRGAAWVTAPLAASLVGGQAYHLVLSAPADTVYSTYGVERGNHYGFAPSTFFADGYGQWTTDGATWSGFDQPGGSKNNTNADLQFYLR